MNHKYLPYDSRLEIERLAGIFNATTTSYKYYWFLALLKFVRKRKSIDIPIKELVIEMISEIWYPINYFKLSYGKQDQFSKNISLLISELEIPADIGKEELILILRQNSNSRTISNLIRDFTRYVPYRFLTPWFSEELRGITDVKKNLIISDLSRKTSKSPYSIVSETVSIYPEWNRYLMTHLAILESFTYWELINYLQKNNPNVPGLSEKLFPPQARNLVVARNYWSQVLAISGDIPCIYSNAILTKHDFSIDHFLPWSFLVHDQIWNLLPTTKSVNSAKSNSLPDITYLEPFTRMQYAAIGIMGKTGNGKLLEDYTMLLKKDLNDILSMDYPDFQKSMTSHFTPLYQIGTNMGFNANWRYGVEGV